MKRLLALLLVLLSMSAAAQKLSISTNILGYLALGTLNADMSYAISRNCSITADIRYNPFTFRKEDQHRQFQCRQQSYAVGARLWPWHIWSGWWFASKLRYQEYNVGGLFSSETEEGDRFGAGFYAGFTYMLSPHFNLEFGAGLWGGKDEYSRYSCQKCGVTVKNGSRFFVLPDDIMVSVVYVF
ncbi:MAG: DUF3575 domain-containing protein [Bacteroidales bacterium]|nr:DUF3575 domain-containing protein [Bacteroidales bacterium]MBQ6689661.1 DUF3575 domain-containing protein [Bacteroidales bacterium]